MYKRTYIININMDPYELDPNLDFALTDIFRRKRNESSPGSFDFEVVCRYNGFIESSRQHKCFNTFLHDMLDGENPYFSSKSEEKFGVYAGYVKAFLSHFDDINRDIRLKNQNQFKYKTMDVFREIYVDGKSTFYGTTIHIPNEILEGKDTMILQVEPDFLTGFFRPEEMFKYAMAPLYSYFYEIGVIDDEELRNIQNYRIGFH